MALAPIESLTRAEVAGITGILTDIDDTITLDGRIVAAAFAALAAAQQAGLRVVPVTGRPAGWCDHIARMWPCDGVVGENGGLWFFMADGKLQRRFLQDEATRIANRARLSAVRAAVLTDVPGAAIASDQPYRELDLAVDFCEDVPALSEEAVDRIVAVFERQGAHCKVSSIHVNGWFGDFDKLTGFARLCEDLGYPSAKERWIYVGDSANDAPMFAHFPLSVGVANVDRFLPRIPTWPAFRTAEEGGHGFAALVRRVLDLRAG
jgi:HAD superfamily hydrolase (TIGR01484 family)